MEWSRALIKIKAQFIEFLLYAQHLSFIISPLPSFSPLLSSLLFFLTHTPQREEAIIILDIKMRGLKLRGCSFCLECKVLMMMLQLLLGKTIFSTVSDVINKTKGEKNAFEDAYEIVRLGDFPTQWEKQKKTAEQPLSYTGGPECRLPEVRAGSTHFAVLQWSQLDQTVETGLPIWTPRFLLSKYLGGKRGAGNPGKTKGAVQGKWLCFFAWSESNLNSKLPSSLTGCVILDKLLNTLVVN